LWCLESKYNAAAMPITHGQIFVFEAATVTCDMPQLATPTPAAHSEVLGAIAAAQPTVKRFGLQMHSPQVTGEKLLHVAIFDHLAIHNV
jgi:hypothetical protein